MRNHVEILMQEKRKNKMNYHFKFKFLILCLLLFGCDRVSHNSRRSAMIENGDVSSADLFTRKSWHDVEGLRIEPVSLPSVSMDQIAGLKIGESVANIEAICGFKPFNYYEGVDFRVIHATSNTGDVYEVAFLMKDGTKIDDISYRNISKEKTNSRSEIDPFGE